MSVRLRDAGNAQRLIKGFKARDAGNVVRTIKTGKIRDVGNVLRTFFQSITMAVTPLTGDITAIRSTSGADKTVSTGPQGFTVVGGVAPITYAWSYVAGDTAIAVSDPAINAPSWSKLLTPDESTSAVWKCVVADAAGASLTVTRNIILQLILVDLSTA